MKLQDCSCASVAQYRSFKRVPVAGWFPALGTAFWLHFRAKNCLAAKSSVVARPPGRFGKHRIGFIYFSYFLLRCCLLRGLAGKPIWVIDFHQATVRAFDPPRTCFSRYTQGFVMRCHGSCNGLGVPRYSSGSIVCPLRLIGMPQARGVVRDPSSAPDYTLHLWFHVESGVEIGFAIRRSWRFE